MKYFFWQLRNPPRKDGTTYVQLFYKEPGFKVIYAPLPNHKILPEHWDSRQHLIHTVPQSDAWNHEFKEVFTQFVKIVKQHKEVGIHPDSKMVRERFGKIVTKGMTMIHDIQKYIDNYAEKFPTRKTRVGQLHCMKASIVEFTRQVRPVGYKDMTYDFIDDYVRALVRGKITKRKKVATNVIVQRYVNDFVGFLVWAKRMRFHDSNAHMDFKGYAGEQLIKKKREAIVLDKDQVEAFLSFEPTTEREAMVIDFCKFLSKCGMRFMDAMTLRWSEVKHLDNYSVYIERLISKNKRARKVPITDEIYEILLSQGTYKKEDFVWGRERMTLDNKAVNRVIKSICKRIALADEDNPLNREVIVYREYGGEIIDIRMPMWKKISIHLFRHYFASTYIENGGTIENLCQILGQEDITTTIRYVHRLRGSFTRTYEEMKAPMLMG